MAVGKNKKLGKKKKGGRQPVNPFAKKEWYDLRAPNVFPIRDMGKTVVTKTIGQRQAKDGLLGRVIEMSLGDLKPNVEEEAFRKFKLRVEDVQGSQCLTNFYGMDTNSHKLRSLVRKWQSTIEAHTDVKTADGYYLRIFVIGFTKRRPNQVSKTSYAQSTKIKAIRKKMIEIIQKEATSVDLNNLVIKLIPETIGKDIEKATQNLYPLQSVMVRKVKMLRSPKTDVNKLHELHQDVVIPVPAATATVADTGKAVERPSKQ